MSYDLTIEGNETHSLYAPKAPLRAFIAGLPGVVPNGPGFAIDDPPRRWMEIDLEVVNAEGDNIEEVGCTYDSVNCISMHVPYSFLGTALERDYLPVALAIAEHLGWPLVDEQTGQVISRDDLKPKPWWRFW